MNKTAMYAGTFDPLTRGHIDVIERAAHIFETLIVAVADRTRKNPLFSLEERYEMTKKSVTHIDNVHVERFKGLLVDYSRSQGVHVLIRGLRAFSDFEYEFQMALTNRKLAPDVETLFLMPSQEYSYVSSSTVREIAQLGGDTSMFAPEPVQKALAAKFGY